MPVGWSKKATKQQKLILGALEQILVDGEEILGVASVNRVRGASVDFMCATNARIMVFDSMASLRVQVNPAAQVEPEWALWSSIKPLEIKTKGLTPYGVRCVRADGQEMPMGQLVERDGRDEFIEILLRCSTNPPRPDVEDRVRGDARVPSDPTATAVVHGSPTTENRYGRVVVDEFFGTSRVRITDSGFVQYGTGWLPGKSRPYHRLIDISLDAQIQKKSGAGRAAGAVLTGGLNLMVANTRGDIYLTITTDDEVHVLTADAGAHGPADLKRGHKLVAAGQAILQRKAAQPQAPTSSPSAHAVSTPPPPPPAPLQSPTPGASTSPVSERLRQLAQLHQEGLITDAEFESRRSQIIDTL
jgi:hypothetical protein